jgi:hypothetical protein
VQVMQTRKRVLGDEHPSTLTSMANLVSTYKNHGRWKKAIALIARCLQLRQQVLGEQHPDSQSTLDTLSSWQLECSNESL